MEEKPSSHAPALVGDFAASLRRTALTQRWWDLVVAAAFGFLAALAAGALLILAGKLQFPAFGRDAGTSDVFITIVIGALAVLGASIHLGDVTVSALPLSALALTGWALSWAVARSVRASGVTDPGEGARLGVRLAVPFAFVCLAASLIFRIREGSPVSADGWGALGMGAIWGALFGILGGVWGAADTRADLRSAFVRWRERHPDVVGGAAAGGLMLVVAFSLAAASGLVWLIFGLLTGGPSGGLPPGELVASVIYLVAFAPNVLTSILSVAVGAPVEFGAQITQRGREIGTLDELSLFDWGGADPPWFAFFLIFVPLIACALGGFYARQIAKRNDRMFPVIGVAAIVFAVVLFEFAALSEARLGAGLVRERGVALVAPREWLVLLFAFVWAFVIGSVGWRLAGSKDLEQAESS
jgi:hypothetical protein